MDIVFVQTSWISEAIHSFISGEEHRRHHTQYTSIYSSSEYTVELLWNVRDILLQDIFLIFWSTLTMTDSQYLAYSECLHTVWDVARVYIESWFYCCQGSREECTIVCIHREYSRSFLCLFLMYLLEIIMLLPKKWILHLLDIDIDKCLDIVVPMHCHDLVIQPIVTLIDSHCIVLFSIEYSNLRLIDSVGCTCGGIVSYDRFPAIIWYDDESHRSKYCLEWCQYLARSTLTVEIIFEVSRTIESVLCPCATSSLYIVVY